MPTQFGATTTDSDNAAPTSLTTSRTQIAGVDPVLVVSVGTEADVAHSSVTFDGQSLTKQVDQLGTGRRVSIWTLINPPVTTANIVVTLGAAADVGMIATSWEDTHQVTPVNATAGNSGSSTSPSVVVASASGERVIDTYNHDNETDPTVGAGQTELADLQVVGDFRMASSHQDGAAPNVTMDWSGIATGDWASAGISLAPAAVAAPPDQPQYMMI